MATPTRDTDGHLAEPRAAVNRDAAEGIARSLKVLTDPTRVQLLGMVVDGPGGRAWSGSSPPRWD